VYIDLTHNLIHNSRGIHRTIIRIFRFLLGKFCPNVISTVTGDVYCFWFSV